MKMDSSLEPIQRFKTPTHILKTRKQYLFWDLIDLQRVVHPFLSFVPMQLGPRSRPHSAGGPGAAVCWLCEAGGGSAAEGVDHGFCSMGGGGRAKRKMTIDGLSCQWPNPRDATSNCCRSQAFWPQQWTSRRAPRWFRWLLEAPRPHAWLRCSQRVDCWLLVWVLNISNSAY